jgi:hypothetical protein
MPHQRTIWIAPASIATLLGFSLWAFGQQSAAPASAPALITGQAERDLIYHPKALAGKRAPLTEREFRAAFANPPAENRSMPLWVWNDQLEWPRLKEQLGQFKAQGMGGVFIHPRPGLMTEYLGADWFRLWKLASRRVSDSGSK